MLKGIILDLVLVNRWIRMGSDAAKRPNKMNGFKKLKIRSNPLNWIENIFNNFTPRVDNGDVNLLNLL